MCYILDNDYDYDYDNNYNDDDSDNNNNNLLLLLPRCYSPEWALASLTFLEGFVTMIVLQGGVVNLTPNPQPFWRTNVFCRGCLP
jgi:hypothetical protein